MHNSLLRVNSRSFRAIPQMKKVSLPFLHTTEFFQSMRQVHNYTRSMNLGTKNFSPNITNKSATTGSPAMSAKATIRQDHRKNYTRDGYLVVKNLFNAAEIDAIQEDIVAIARGKFGSFEGYVPADGSLRDTEVVSLYSRIEHPHKLSPKLTFDSIAHPKIVDILTCLIGPNIKCMSSKLYIHGPGERSRVWHQDEQFIPTRDRSLVCALIAIDDISPQAGGSYLLAHPGSHRSGVLYSLRTATSTSVSSTEPNVPVTPVEFSPLPGETSGEDTEEFGNEIALEAFDSSRDPDAGVPLDMPAGSVAFVNGYTMQRMVAAHGSKLLSRSVKAHYCSAESWLPWNMDGKIPFTSDNRDIFMVAGKDPYAYKGITPTLSKPKAHSFVPVSPSVN